MGIPPSSMMIKSEESDKSKKGQRTDFLGALKESTKDNSKDSNKDPDDLGTFDHDSRSNNLIRSTLVDVTHPVSFATSTLSEAKNDTLSELFEEITDAQSVAQNTDEPEVTKNNETNM